MLTIHTEAVIVVAYVVTVTVKNWKTDIWQNLSHVFDKNTPDFKTILYAQEGDRSIFYLLLVLLKSRCRQKS